MFTRTAIKRYTTVRPTAENFGGNPASTAEHTLAFIGGIMFLPALLGIVNMWPSTRRASQVPMYSGSEKYFSKSAKTSSH